MPMAPGLPVPGAAFPEKKLAEGRGGDEKKEDKKETLKAHDNGGAGNAAAGAPVRVREYFPETMLWRPSIITDERGRAN